MWCIYYYKRVQTILLFTLTHRMQYFGFKILMFSKLSCVFYFWLML